MQLRGLTRGARIALAWLALATWTLAASAQPPPEHVAPAPPGQTGPTPEAEAEAHAAATPAPAPAPAPEGAADQPASVPSSSIDVRASSEVGAYGDTDHVFVLTPTVAGSISKPTEGWSVDGRYLVDVVSAASVDIVSAASRRWEEIRHVGTLGGAYKPGTFGIAASANISSEPDYLSLNAGGSIQQDLLDKHLTLLFGYNHGHDTAGRTGTPFSVFSHKIDSNGFKAGATVIVNRTTVASFIGDVILESGDSSKPYRYVPMFAPGTSIPLGASIDWVTSQRLSGRPLEQLPTSRQRFAVSGRLAHRFDQTTLRLDERLYADTWALMATTTDLRLLSDTSRRVELGPHVRFHAQKSVNFWQRGYILEPGFNYPEYRTGDRELGPLIGITGGGTLRIGLGAAEHPTSWVLGFDANAITTRYLDDIYLTHRESLLFSVSLEVEL